MTEDITIEQSKKHIYKIAELRHVKYDEISDKLRGDKDKVCVLIGTWAVPGFWHGKRRWTIVPYDSQNEARSLFKEKDIFLERVYSGVLPGLAKEYAKNGIYEKDAESIDDYFVKKPAQH